MFRAGIVGLVAVMLMATAPILQTANQPQSIKTGQKTEHTPSGQDNKQNKVAAKTDHVSSGTKSHSDDQGSEYWPTIFGLRLKITDSLLALFTFFLVIAGAVQGYFTNRQIALARDEFNATHRPRVVVTNLSLTKELVDGGSPTICFTVRNTGDSPCKVIEIRSASFTLEPNEKIPSDMSFPFVEKFDYPLAAGGGKGLFPANGTIVLKDEAFPVFEGKRILFCIGTVTYEGVGGKREMGFCRRHTPPDHWEATSSEYEYSY